MLIVLLGKTCSGKTTLVDSMKPDLKKIVTYTTRPKRPNEVDSIDYHFISVEKFKEMEASGKFIETASYNASFGKCYYGSSKKSLINAVWDASNDYVIILNPYGYKALEKSGLEFISIYLNVSEDELFKRALARGDDTKEIKRRLKTDNFDFKNIENEVDIILTDNSLEESKNFLNKLINVKGS